MNESIYEYCLLTYGEDVTFLIEQTFNRFEEYGLEDYETRFFNIITNESYVDPAGMQDDFYALLLEYIYFILQAHGIQTNEQATLRELNELLDSIKILQNLLDYTEVLYIIESDEDDFTKFARMIEVTSCLTETRVKDIIEDVDENFIKVIKYLIRDISKSNESYVESDTDVINKIITNARKFNNFVEGKPTLGVQMMDQGLLLGEEFKTYIPYIEEHLKPINDPKLLATNLYSVVILSSDGYNNPLMCYKDNINSLTFNPEVINNLEVAYNNFSAEYESYKRGTSSRLR